MGANGCKRGANGCNGVPRGRGLVGASRAPYFGEPFDTAKAPPHWHPLGTLLLLVVWFMGVGGILHCAAAVGGGSKKSYSRVLIHIWGFKRFLADSHFHRHFPGF